METSEQQGGQRDAGAVDEERVLFAQKIQTYHCDDIGQSQLDPGHGNGQGHQKFDIGKDEGEGR